MKRKTIGVIGLGSIGMRHAKNLLVMGQNVIGWDVDESKCQALAADGGWAAVERPPFTWKEIHRCDGVVVASPSYQHLGHMKQAIYRDKPVFVEKPISDCANTSYLRELLDEADTKSLPVMVGNNLRFHCCVKEAKRRIDAGVFEESATAEFRVAQYTDKKPYLRDGVTLNWGAHEIDLALYLLGPARVVGSEISITDDVARIGLVHRPGVVSVIYMDYITNPEQRWFVVSGDRESVSADLVKRTLQFVDCGGEPRLTVFKDGFDLNYIDEMQTFLNLIDGEKGPIAATGRDGLATLEIINEAKRMAGIK